jgi:hypothetical protein
LQQSSQISNKDHKLQTENTIWSFSIDAFGIPPWATLSITGDNTTSEIQTDRRRQDSHKGVKVFTLNLYLANDDTIATV